MHHIPKHEGTIIDSDGCELEVWVAYRDDVPTPEPEVVLIVFDGKTIGNFPYNLPDADKISQAADKITRGDVTEIDLRLMQPAAQSIKPVHDIHDGVIDDADTCQPYQVTVPFQYGSKRLTACFAAGKCTVVYGTHKITDSFSIGQANDAMKILALGSLAPHVDEIQHALAAGHQDD